MTGFTEERGKQRIKLATRFYDEVVLPHIDGLNQEKLMQSLGLFRQVNKGPGDDFDLDHVWAISWKRSVLVDAHPDKVTVRVTSQVKKAFQLLSEIELQDGE